MAIAFYVHGSNQKVVPKPKRPCIVYNDYRNVTVKLNTYDVGGEFGMQTLCGVC
jgi:hypothetical protein